MAREESLAWPENLKYLSLSRDDGRFLSVGGQLRLRSETWRDFGFGGLAGRDDTYGLSRLRLHTDWHLSPHVRLFVEGLSALSTGRDLPGGDRILDVDSADFQNAFLDVRVPIDGGSVTLRVGRRELEFGRQRLVSPLDWSNTRPRAFDGVQGIYRITGWRIDGFWTRHVRTRKYSLNSSAISGTDFYGLYAAGRLGSSVSELDLYWLGLTRETASYSGVTGKEQRQTIGMRLGGRVPDYRLDFDTETALQLGDHAGRHIRSWMATSLIGLTPQWPAEPRFFVGLDLAGGDGDPDDPRVGTFHHLFPLGHAYFGDIDMIGRQNIVDFSQGMVLKLAGRLGVTAELHRFWRMSRADGPIRRRRRSRSSGGFGQSPVGWRRGESAGGASGEPAHIPERRLRPLLPGSFHRGLRTERGDRFPLPDPADDLLTGGGQDQFHHQRAVESLANASPGVEGYPKCRRDRSRHGNDRGA